MTFTSSSAPYFFLLFSLILSIPTLGFGGCIEGERVALLQFKDGLTDPSDRLSDWISDGSDCCTWTGVVCHNVTFHVLELHLRTLSPEEYLGPERYDPDRYVIDISEYVEYRFSSVLGGTVNDSLLELKHLSYLDLSYNNFEGIPIPTFIGSSQSLRYLNLSRAGFGGIIPPQLGNLSNLQYLNLHATYSNRLSFGTDYRLNVEKLDWISSLSSLEFLDMSGVDLSQSIDWLKVINPLSSLIELHMSQCSLPNLNPPRVPSLNLSSILVLDLSKNYLGGPIPKSFQNMTSSFLSELDLSYNIFNSSIPNWFYGLTHLQLLDLYFNHFEGQISSDIGNLTSLTRLDMSGNDKLLELEKGIPPSFRNFCSLRSLSLRYVKLNQEINDVLAIMSSGSCVSNVLQSLDLSHCKLSGHLTDDLSYFKNLIKFDISSNSISGPIPLSFGELNSLEYLSLSKNRLNGSLSFENLTRLVVLDASGNSIALRVRSDCIPPLQLGYLCLGSWHIGPQFPKWLRLLKHLTYLDLSNSAISTPVPIWFWDSFNCY
ncbi:Receptor-like protein EIX1 [Euphorbia peplus]|nr:Receptor-like protein EIX1 [Euphorbia peplus]